MCGRYGMFNLSKDDYSFIKDNKGYVFKPNYNVAPSQRMPVFVLKNDRDLELVEMQWGIRRVVGPDAEKNIINTRSDKAFGRFWGKTVRQKRCLIPANGFYEWKTKGKLKIPYWIHPRKTNVFAFAGIYSEDEDGNKHYSIMTTEPNKEMRNIHSRMPVILTKAEESKWLLEDKETAMSELLRPYHDDGLEIYEVSKDVNNPRNNTAELIARTV